MLVLCFSQITFGLIPLSRTDLFLGILFVHAKDLLVETNDGPLAPLQLLADQQPNDQGEPLSTASARLTAAPGHQFRPPNEPNDEASDDQWTRKTSVTIRLCRPAVGSGSVGVSNAANYLCVVPPDDHAIFCRRRHQPRRPPLARINPGSPAPAMGPGTGFGSP